MGALSRQWRGSCSATWEPPGGERRGGGAAGRVDGGGRRSAEPSRQRCRRTRTSARAGVRGLRRRRRHPPAQGPRSHLGHSCSLATLGWAGSPPNGAGHAPCSRKYSSVRYWYLRGAAAGAQPRQGARAHRAPGGGAACRLVWCVLKLPRMASPGGPRQGQLGMTGHRPAWVTPTSVGIPVHGLRRQRAALSGSERHLALQRRCACPHRAAAPAASHLVTLSPTNTSLLPARHRCACAWLNRCRRQPRTASWSAVPLAWLHCTAHSGSGPRRVQCGGGGGGGGAGGNRGRAPLCAACAAVPLALAPPPRAPRRMQPGSARRQLVKPGSVCTQ